MKNIMAFRWPTAALALLLVIAGCGGGGITAPPAGSKIAVLTLSTSGTLAPNTHMGALEVTVILPPGVTVKANPDSAHPSVLVTDAKVVVPLASRVLISYGTYSAATATLPGTVAIRMVSGTGFGTGAFAEVTCNIADSSDPSAADFALSDFVAYELDTAATMPHITAGFTAAFTRDNGSAVTH